jgi:hypothetical protein
VAGRQYADWVAPIAQRLSESRTSIAEAARSVPASAWGNASGYEGWSFRDQLAHLGDSHESLHGVLNSVLGGDEIDFSRFMNIDAVNAENLAKHTGETAEGLAAAFVRNSEQTAELMTRLTDEHEGVKFGPMTLGIALQGFSLHDVQHLEEIKKALA